MFRLHLALSIITFFLSPGYPKAYSQVRDIGSVADSAALTEDSAKATVPSAGKARLPDLLMIGLSFVGTSGGGSFFDDYHRIGGKKSALDGYATIAMSIRPSLNEAFQLHLYGAYLSQKMDDLYDVRTKSDSADPTSGRLLASMVENLSIRVFPVMVGFDFTPVRTQFMTYIGLTAGVAVSSVSWSTILRRQPLVDYYRPGKNVNSVGISPAMRVFFGSDLRFDKTESMNKSMLRGLFLEGSYLYLPVSRSFFQNIIAQGSGLPQSPLQESASVQSGGFTITFGLVLQFFHE